LYAAAQAGFINFVRCLVEKCGANVNQVAKNGCTALYIAAYAGHENVVRCLLGECGASVNKVAGIGVTALFAVAQEGHERVVRCLVKEFGADVNIAATDGSKPLMAAAEKKRTEVVVWLTKHGADSQASQDRLGTAAEISKRNGAPAEQTAYLEARTHCAKPGCSEAGLKKLQAALSSSTCGKECQLLHWPAHKAKCKRKVEQAVGKGSE
jgi:ankyrin repeat protein